MHVYKHGDRYPPLRFEDQGRPVDLTDMRVTYDFVPDSPRASKRRGVPLKILDPQRGEVAPPRPRTTGICALTFRFPNGSRWTSPETILIVR